MPNSRTIVLWGRGMWGWIRFWWLKVPEPRVVSLISGALYSVMVITGLFTLFLPPQTYQGVFADLVIQLVGYFFIGGGIVGIVGGTLDFWQLERVGVSAMLLGLGFYLYIVANLQVMSDSGNRFTQMGVMVSLGVSLMMRMAMIWRYPYKPRG